MKIINHQNIKVVAGGCETCCQQITNEIPFYQPVGAARLIDIFEKLKCDWIPFHIDIQFS